jgi:hypothetical protein
MVAGEADQSRLDAMNPADTDQGDHQSRSSGRLLYLAIRNIEKKWTQQPQYWNRALETIVIAAAAARRYRSPVNGCPRPPGSPPEARPPALAPGHAASPSPRPLYSCGRRVPEATMNSTTKLLITLVALSLAVIVLGGCSKAATTQPEATPNVNSDKPNANARIQVQTALGDPAKGSEIHFMTVVDGSSYNFAGRRDNSAGVGRIGPSGASQWFSILPYVLRGVLTLSPSVSVPGGLVAVGKLDNDNDGLSDIGNAWLYTASGSLVSTVLFSSDTSDVWVNGIAAVSDSEFVLVGGERTPARTNPLVAIVTLTAGGQLAKGPQVVLNGLSNSYFGSVAVNPAGPSGGLLHIYASAEVVAGSGPVTAIYVHGLTAAYPAMTSWNVDWSRNIPGAGPTLEVNDLRVYEDRIYLAGGTDDTGKQPPPSDGGYWDSGLAARLTLAGALEWTSIIRLTAHTERFRAVVPTANGIFFMGIAGRYFTGQTVDQFGYGWIARILPATGVVATHLTFGSDAYESGFDTGVYSGSTMYCGGFTNYENQGGGYRSWFCGIDLANTVASSAPDPAGAAPIPGRIGDSRVPSNDTR